jgi:hypothetical protein
LWLCLLAISALAQLSSGTILGTVTDASGALVPGVTVKIINPATSLAREVVTNEDGNFRVESLPIGFYQVEFEKAGFKKEIRAGVKVDIDQRVRVDVALSAGAVTDVVNITAEASLVQKDDTSLGQVIEERKIVTLPLNGRNFSQLAYIVPGAFAPRAGSQLSARGSFAVAGLHESYNQFLLDGVNNNGAGTMEINSRVNIDAVGEFKVQTGVYQAQYGRYAGAQVDVVTKSGTNELHGSAFAFTRNDNLDTRNALDSVTRKGDPLPEFKRHQFGAALGGPIIKDKLFYFAAYQGQRQGKFLTVTPSVPLPQFFTGDLSVYTTPIRDPQRAGACTVTDRTACFPGNIIPTNRISAIAQKFFGFWPAPTTTGLVRNTRVLLPNPDNYDQPTTKINWNINSRHSLSGMYNFYDERFLETLGSDFPQFLSDSLVRSQTLALSEVWTISSAMVNEFRAGFSRLNRSRLSRNRDRNYNQEFGILGAAADTEREAWGVPLVNVTGFSSVGDSATLPQPRIEMPFTVADTLSIQRGNHSFKLGGDYFKQVINGALLLLNARGAFNFTGSVTGNAFADFLLGLPATASRQPPLGPVTSYSRRNNGSLFFQDDWRATRGLTLNLGIRWDFMGALTEKNQKLSTFDPYINGGRGGLRLVGDDAFWNNAVATYQRLFPNVYIERGSNHLYRPDWNNVAPRLGLAWSPFPDKNTVVRAGYGVFFQIQEAGFNEFWLNPPFFIAQTFTNTTAGIPWSNPFAGNPALPSLTAVAIDKFLATPYAQQWALNVQHQLPGAVVLDASYVGKKGTKLRQTRDINQPLNRSSAAAAVASRPFAGFAQIAQQENSANSIYHGLQLRGEKRASNGMTFLVSYIYGKMIDNTVISGANTPPGTQLPQDSYNLAAERALSSDDIRHRFSASYIAPLPFGRGRKFLSNLDGFGQAVLGGWELAGIYRANTGSPFNPVLSVDNSRTTNRRDRPNLIGNPNLSNPTSQRWWDVTAFVIPPAGSFGTAGRNVLIGPGTNLWDFSLQKNFYIRERHQAQFRFDLFNFLNHANYNTPVTTVNAANFGAVTTAQDSRQIQLGLRYQF